jgi:hypothetical protein
MANRQIKPMGEANSASSRSFPRRQPYGWYAVALILLVIAGIAYAWYDRRHPSWREEVRLSDGRVIWIRQKHEYYENYGTNQSWVTFSLPELGGERTWHSYLIPQRIDVANGRVFVFGFPRGDRQYAYYNYPRRYMVAFTWNGSDFQRIPFLQVPEALRGEENVLSCLPEARRAKVSLAVKAQWWCPPQGDKKQFTKKIDLPAYEALATSYSRRSGGAPISE